MNGASSRVNEFLDEDLSKYPIRLFSENGAENDGDSVVAGFDIDSFLFTVVDGHDVSTLSDTLRRFLGRILGSGLFELVVFFVGMLEGCSHSVALQQGDLLDEIIPRLYTNLLVPTVRLRSSIQHTLVSRKVLEVDQDGEIIAWLRRNYIFAILSVKHLFSAILYEISIAFDLNGNKNLGLYFRSGDVEEDAVEVGHGLVDRHGGRSRE